MNFKSLMIIALCTLLNINMTFTDGQASASYCTDTADAAVVAVIDSKIQTEHEALKGRCMNGKSFLIDKSSDKGHGTSVAGAVVEYSDKTAEILKKGRGNVQILPVEINVTDIQEDYGIKLGEAIEYAINMGADVINMSFSCPSPSLYVYEKIQEGIAKGIIFVSAAGNTGYDIYSFPASYEGVISVGSYTVCDGRYIKSSFSNSNDSVDLIMPGEKLLLPDDNMIYSEKTGTSFSSGALSGIVAELISLYPDLTPEHIVYTLFDTAAYIDSKGCGYGVPDILKASDYLNKIRKTDKSPIAAKSTQNNIPSKVKNKYNICISAGRSCYARMIGGKAEITGSEDYKVNIRNWDNIIKIYAGSDNIAAIDSNSHPMAAGYNLFNKNIFKGWINVNELALSPNFTAGLTNDGKIYATDYLMNAPKKEIQMHIKQISAGSYHLAGVTDNGKVITVGYNMYGQMNTEKWHDIIMVSSGKKNTAAVDRYGNAFAVGDNMYGQCDLDDWSNLVSISVGDGFVAGLKSNGTVVVKGRNTYDICRVEDLKNIVYINASDTYFTAIDSDGKVYIKGKIRI